MYSRLRVISQYTSRFSSLNTSILFVLLVGLLSDRVSTVPPPAAVHR